MSEKIKQIPHLNIFRYYQVAFKIDGYYFKDCRDSDLKHLIPKQCFNKAKEEVISQIEKDIEYIRLMTFDDFQAIKRADFNSNSPKRHEVEKQLQRSPLYREKHKS